VVKLGNKEKLEADEIRGDWTHVSNVIRLSEADASPNQKLVQGWVRSKYLVERQCYDDPANGPLPSPQNLPGLMANGAGIDNVLPPVEFDHPYQGVLTIKIIATLDELRDICPGRMPVACSERARDGSSCTIWRLPDWQIETQHDEPVAVLMRHEIGHCNGWGDDHRGARAWIKPQTHKSAAAGAMADKTAEVLAGTQVSDDMTGEEQWLCGKTVVYRSGNTLSRLTNGNQKTPLPRNTWEWRRSETGGFALIYKGRACEFAD
jgi:hypothetical protein